MATIIPGTIRQRSSNYGFYAQPVGGTDTIFVRRQLGVESNTLHANNKALRIQRLRLAAAAKAYSKLSYYQKRWWRHRLEYV